MGRKSILSEERYQTIVNSLNAHNMKDIAKVAEECNCSTSSVLKVKKSLAISSRLSGFTNENENFLRQIGKMIDLCRYFIKTTIIEDDKAYWESKIEEFITDLQTRQRTLDEFKNTIVL